jgi:hypothetical protein
MLQTNNLSSPSTGTVDSCKCEVCQAMCINPCVPSPSQFLSYPREIKKYFRIDSMLNERDEEILLWRPKQIHFHCTFLTKDNLCTLHNNGMKPIEAQLVIHSMTRKECTEIHSLVLSEWEDIPMDMVESLEGWNS